MSGSTVRNSALPLLPPHLVVKLEQVDAVIIFPAEKEIAPLPLKMTPVSGEERSPCEYLALFAATRTRKETTREAGGGKSPCPGETIVSSDGAILVGTIVTSVGMTVILVETIVTLVDPR